MACPACEARLRLVDRPKAYPTNTSPIPGRVEEVGSHRVTVTKFPGDRHEEDIALDGSSRSVAVRRAARSRPDRYVAGHLNAAQWQRTADGHQGRQGGRDRLARPDVQHRSNTPADSGKPRHLAGLDRKDVDARDRGIF